MTQEILPLAPRLDSIRAVFDKFFSVHEGDVRFAEPASHRLVGAVEQGRPAYDARLANWYQFIISRAFQLAAVDSQTAVSAAALDALNPAEFLARLERAFGYELDTSPELEAMFNPTRAESLTGVALGRLRRHPRLRKLVAGRYEGLVDMCVYADPVTSDDVLVLMQHPSSGVLCMAFVPLVPFTRL